MILIVIFFSCKAICGEFTFWQIFFSIFIGCDIQTFLRVLHTIFLFSLIHRYTNLLEYEDSKRLKQALHLFFNPVGNYGFGGSQTHLHA